MAVFRETRWGLCLCPEEAVWRVFLHEHSAWHHLTAREWVLTCLSSSPRCPLHLQVMPDITQHQKTRKQMRQIGILLGFYYFFLYHSCWNEAFWSPQEAPDASDLRASLQPELSAVMLKSNVRRSPDRAFMFSHFNVALRASVISALTTFVLSQNFCSNNTGAECHWGFFAEKSGAVATDGGTTVRRLEWRGACCPCTTTVCSACVRPLWGPSLS